MLIPRLYYYFTEEQGGKWDIIGPTGRSGLKRILTLLAEVVAIYMEVIIIEF